MSKKENKRYVKELREKHVSTKQLPKQQKDELSKIYDKYRKRSDSSNDPNWWLPKDISAQLVASYPWNTMAGFDISKSIASVYAADEAPNIAGIMRLHFASSFPYSISQESALNRASLGLFADILTKNSSNVPFEHTDLMMSLIALSDVDSFIALGMRAYGLLHNYPVQNRYVARALIEACGFNYDDLVSDPYAFVSRLNVIVSRRNRFYIPKSFNWRKREVWLHSNVYKDSDDPKSQFYTFVKDSYSKWSPRTSERGTLLIQYNWTANYGYKMTQDEYFELLNDMLTPLENDQDVYIMQGYILKRYEQSEFVVMPMLDPGFTVTPVVDHDTLVMIQNTKLYYDITLEDDGESEFTALSQVDGHFLYNPIYYTHSNNTENILITTCFKDPSPEDTIEATRNIIAVSNSAEYGFIDDVGKVSRIEPAECGADHVYKVSIYSLKSDGQILKFTYDYRQWGLNLATRTRYSQNDYLLTQISYFDFHPIINVVSQNAENDPCYFIGYVGDFDNTMILPQEALAKMNGVLTYGIVNIVDVIK